MTHTVVNRAAMTLYRPRTFCTDDLVKKRTATLYVCQHTATVCLCVALSKYTFSKCTPNAPRVIQPPQARTNRGGFGAQIEHARSVWSQNQANMYRILQSERTVILHPSSWQSNSWMLRCYRGASVKRRPLGKGIQDVFHPRIHFTPVQQNLIHGFCAGGLT